MGYIQYNETRRTDMKTATYYIKETEKTRNGGSGLCYVVIFRENGIIVDRVYVGSKERAKEMIKNSS